MAVVLCYFTEFSSFGINYVTVVEESSFWQHMTYGDIFRDYQERLH